MSDQKDLSIVRGRTFLSTQREAEKAKSVRVFTNGDAHPARPVTLNTRHVRDFTGALELITQSLRPAFGAVRRLYTPDNGTHVDSLSGILDGKDYVAAGTAPFRAMNYHRIVSGHTARVRTNTMPSKMQTLPAVPRVERSARAARMAQERPPAITVVRNGDISGRGVRVVIPRNAADDLSLTLAAINEKVTLASGALRKLYTFEGIRVLSTAQITDGGHYVAVGREHFAKYDYLSHAPLNSEKKLQRMLPTTTAVPSYQLPIHRTSLLFFTGPPQQLLQQQQQQQPQQRRIIITNKRKQILTSPLKQLDPEKRQNEPTTTSPVPESTTAEATTTTTTSTSHVRNKKAVQMASKVQSYNVSVLTGKDGIFTGGRVMLTMIGDIGRINKHALINDDIHQDDQLFQPESTEIIAIQSNSIGPIGKIIVDYSGVSSWFLKSIVIRDVATDIKYRFSINKLLQPQGPNNSCQIEVDVDIDDNDKQSKTPKPRKPSFLPSPVDDEEEDNSKGDLFFAKSLTGKYNTKALRKRLELEEWINNQLELIFDNNDEIMVHLDYDDVLSKQPNKRLPFLQETLASAPRQDLVSSFIKTLLEKIDNLDKV